MEVSISRAGSADRPVFTAFIRDISGRRQREAERAWTLRKLAQAQEVTRAQIASELHDDTVQIMAAVLLSLDRVLAQSDLAGHHALVRARRLLAEATDRTRRLMFELRPAILHERGLAAAVAVLADEVTRETGAVVALRIPDRRYDSILESLVYRSLQEALANVRKHAAATNVTVTVADDDSDTLVAVVCDDGRGFDFDATLARTRAEMHMGLDTMIERARTHGGSCIVESRPGAGPTITFSFPPDAPAAASQGPAARVDGPAR